METVSVSDQWVVRNGASLVGLWTIRNIPAMETFTEISPITGRPSTVSMALAFHPHSIKTVKVAVYGRGVLHGAHSMNVASVELTLVAVPISKV